MIKKWHPSVEGDFVLQNLEKNAKYILSINEYNDLGSKCKRVGGFYNPHDLKEAPGVKRFKADNKGKFERSFKNLPLSITGRDSIINRSCVLKKVRYEDSDSESESKHKNKKKDLTKCSLITWEPPYWTAGKSAHE